MTVISRKIRLALACVLSAMPFGVLRRALYRLLFSYHIDRYARIGFLSVIAVDTASLGKCNIGRMNWIVGPFSIEVGDGASVGFKNVISAGFWSLGDQYQAAGYRRCCRIGDRGVVTNYHFIDVVGGFDLGNDTWIAGRGSQFWTHGAGAHNRSIVIGRNCYIGPASRFAPGALIGDNVVVGVGSCVVGRHTGANSVLAGNPARVVKEQHLWRDLGGDTGVKHDEGASQ